MKKDAKIYIAGHNGMVGSGLLRRLKAEGYTNFLLRSSKELDLRNQQLVNELFEQEKPEYVFIAAAKVGGILANDTYRAEFLYDNLIIQTNVIHAAYMNKVKKLMFLGSSCIYPELAPQPLREDFLLLGPLGPTNQPYAIAKIAGIKMCDAYRDQYGCNYISVMPTNLYGPNDNYDLQKSHVLPALIRKFHEAKRDGAKEVVIWGTGSPLREFLHVDDMVDACYHLMLHYDEGGLVNVGMGKDISIKNLALLVKEIVGFEGDLAHDMTKPDGTPRKLLDITKLEKSGWTPKISLRDGIAQVYADLQGEEWY